jgi:MFS family permease
MKHVFRSKNAYIYPLIGFFIVGITLVISAFLHQLYPGQDGGYIAGLLLYGCAIGAFMAPFIAKKFGIKKVTLSVVIGAVLFWLMVFILNQYYTVSWLYVVPVAFLFGVCFQASWPLALYSQEIEEGVTEANVGIAASLYISISNIGAAVLPVIFPLLFPSELAIFIAVIVSLLICVLLWAVVKRT